MTMLCNIHILLSRLQEDCSFLFLLSGHRRGHFLLPDHFSQQLVGCIPVTLPGEHTCCQTPLHWALVTISRVYWLQCGGNVEIDQSISSHKNICKVGIYVRPILVKLGLKSLRLYSFTFRELTSVLLGHNQETKQPRYLNQDLFVRCLNILVFKIRFLNLSNTSAKVLVKLSNSVWNPRRNPFLGRGKQLQFW